MPLPLSPFDPSRVVGTVCEVGPTYAKLNLPKAANSSPAMRFGERVGRGEVGEFVFLECGSRTVLGRITSVELPGRDRLQLEPTLGRVPDVHPIGHVQLLTTIELRTGKVIGGVSEHPRLGTSAYSAHPELLAHVAEKFGTSADSAAAVTLDIGTLPAANNLPVSVTPERLFGRHCAVVGTTGGGKSFTLARLLHQCARYQSRVILLDATGEYHTLGNLAQHCHFGTPLHPMAGSTEVVLPYEQLTELDLFALFQPSGKTQGPKLRAAIGSLKLARAQPTLAPGGNIEKAGRPRAPIITAMQLHAAAINSPGASFDISKLVQQIVNECVWPTDFKDASKFGGDNGEMTYCVALVSRINAMLQSEALAPIFQTQGKASLYQILTAFLANNQKPILRISLEHVQFEHFAREILANAIGRDLMIRARKDRLGQRPLLVFLDEAHQFLNRSLGDEDTAHRLDAFEIIAKEGRGYSLNICLATQRPRDIPDGVLSQMGTLIVHRLINDRDRSVVERAAGEIDRSAAAFLPTLAPGEAAVLGVDFPIPLTVQMQKPPQIHWPDSRGPDFQASWQPTP